MIFSFDEIEIANVFDGHFGGGIFAHVIEDDSLNGDHFTSDHRIRQIELDEERSEHLQLSCECSTWNIL